PTACLAGRQGQAGKPFRGDLSNYVLSDFSSQEKEILKNVISEAASACIDWVNFGADFAMRNYNKKDKGLRKKVEV
ncbi:MAG: hypothetical protein KKE55_05915, partial [Candidatus Omnitrophica bacterium]|nr:hypothetical protein [Candidatus Omnitrophota bacterium]MBU2437212.1 hypothetical protein [Candidatus Omnitrophota bacterium]